MRCDNNTYQKLSWSIILLYLLYWLYEGHFLFQLDGPVFKITGIDNTYWLFCILRIPQFVIQHAILLDGLLIILFATSVYTKNKWLFRILFITVIIHVITFNVYAGVHTKSCVFLPLILLPFCFPKNEELLKDGLRYYLLFVFVSAAMYKIANGGLFHTHQFVHILENQHTDLAILHPTHFTYIISIWLIKHPVIADCLWYLFTLLEFNFIVGFFTKKQDTILAFILILIIVNTYILMRISLFDFLLFLPLLINTQTTSYANKQNIVSSINN